MFIFLAWIVFSIAPALIANRKGRNGAGWFFLSLLISPLLAGIIVLCLEPIKGNVEAAAVETGGMKKCPYCAELIKAEAALCRYCGKEQPPAKIPRAIPTQPRPALLSPEEKKSLANLNKIGIAILLVVVALMAFISIYVTIK